MDRNQYSLRFDRMVVMSIIAHCLLLLFVSLLWGGSAVPAIKTVQLVIESRPVAREVIAEVKRESAPGRVKRDAVSTGSAEESLESLLERSTFPINRLPKRMLRTENEKMISIMGPFVVIRNLRMGDWTGIRIPRICRLTDLQ